MNNKTKLEKLAEARAELRQANLELKKAQSAAKEILNAPTSAYRRAVSKALQLLPPFSTPGRTRTLLDKAIREKRQQIKDGGCCEQNGFHGPLPGGCGCHCHEI